MPSDPATTAAYGPGAEAARKREAATREILQVISQSRDNDRPVFDAILQNATRLCGADSAALLLGTPGGPHLTLAALWQLDRISRDDLDRFIADINRVPMPMDPSLHISARAICTGGVVHIHDLAQTEGYLSGEASFRFMVDDQGMRTTLSVPIFGADGPIGCISVHRNTVRPYRDDEIALIQTFAAQAVIAIENARQFCELQTRLARERASAEILEVISRSRDDERPVFDVVLRKAAELCHASNASLNVVSDDRSKVTRVAAWGTTQISAQLPVGVTSWPMDSGNAPAVCVREGRVVHLHDMADTELYRSGDQLRVAAVDGLGIRTFLAVPLVSGDRVVGCISTFRLEVRPFAPDEIALVETFAAQAVIAIENVRQFRELQTRLEREAATREILSVISQSRDDDTPVFEMIAQSAARLCRAAVCTFWRVKDGLIHYCASHGLDSGVVAEMHLIPSIPLLDNTLTGQVVKTRAVARIEDATAESYHDHEWARAQGVKQFIGVPIFVGDDVWGSISLMWPAERAPRDADIQLVESFAAQASIAIENVRQFRELQTRLAREAATRNILRVISESPDDEQPTFEAILDSATRLCGTPYASIVLGRRGDASQRMAAHRGAMAETLAFFRDGRVPMDPEDSIGARAILEGRTIHVPDMADTDQYRAGHERFRMVVDRQGLRTNLFVPLLASEGGIGCFILWKKEVAPFTADQIALMETFASHAVIAIENVRQFKALERLNAELGDRVQAQVGEIERMGRLKRFLPAAVADAVVTSGSEKLLSSHRALLGVLFCDIRGFTAFCETAEPEETIEVLQTYHEEMGRLIAAHGAGVDHRMGDGIMVLFNDPLPCDDPAGDAVRLAMAMRDRMAGLCAKWKKMGHRLGFGVGISLGYATVGMVGSGGRFDYTASGTAVNLAARLCDEALDGEILVSPRARTAVEGSYAVQSRGDRSLKGIREPVEIFAVTGVLPPAGQSGRA